MTRIAIIGGGISGLTAAYELELARRRGAPVDWQLFEAADRLGGIIETTRHITPAGDYILEGGPDGWVSEKPWARELAIELGLEDQLIGSNDATRRTYILLNGKLQPIPGRMRMMVPEDLAALEGSPLFTASARAAYAAELTRAAELKSASPFADPTYDESVAAFVLRHFGEEVFEKLAAPLLSGVFGGDVHRLSVRAVLPQFAAMERDHGSLIAALQAKSSERKAGPPQPIFTSLRNGMGSLVDAIVAQLPPDRLHLNTPVKEIGNEGRQYITLDEQRRRIGEPFDHLLLATSLDVSRDLLSPDSGHGLRELLPTEASSAILATFTWPAELGRAFTLPPGFGFLVPQDDCHPDPESGEGKEPALRFEQREPQLLACTFVDQKFPHRAPAGARILRTFFGGHSAEALNSHSDTSIATAALTQLRDLLGQLPDPAHIQIHRLPRSLPQYEVGHLDRMARLDRMVAQRPGLHLLGNAYRGVGLPDLIRHARDAARDAAASALATPP